MAIRQLLLRCELLAQIGFNKIYGARGLSLPGGIHQNGRVVAFQHGERQVVTASAEIHHRYLRRQEPLAQQTNHFDAESVIAKKNVSNTGNKNTFHTVCLVNSSTSSNP